MADRSQMLTSPAYRALSPAGRKVLAAIEREVERCGGVVTVSLADFGKLCGVSKSAVAYGLKQVALLGLVSVEQRGPRQRLMNIFQLADGWIALDADTAKRRQLQALLPKRQPAPQPVRPQRQTPSLPKLSWDDAR